MQYNQAFFSLFENVDIILNDKFGASIALELFREIMERGLIKAFGDDFTQGDPDTLVDMVGQGDKAVA